MNITIRKFDPADIKGAVSLWNFVVNEGICFPQLEGLDEQTGMEFFLGQYTAVAVDNDSGRIVGLYILHPNNIGRCGHIANASYAVDAELRGCHIGEALVKDCLAQGKRLGYKILQFNAVVATNTHARHLYRRLGFIELGRIPGGFLLPDGSYEDIFIYYHTL